MSELSKGKEEIYSTMFSSLKHPVRRKILRVLADKPVSFSELLDLLGVSSPHLTYHLESLGELISKSDDGIYRLSTFGLASVNTMKIVEEAPPVQPRKRLALSFKWKAILAALVIGLILVGSMTYIQYGSLSQLSSEHSLLQSQYNQLLSWSASTNNAINFLRNVTQIDVSKYQATLLSRTVEPLPDLGGILQESMRYSLTSADSSMEVVFRFRQNKLSKYEVLLEGTPAYAQAQPHNVLDAAKGVLERFSVYQDMPYFENMTSMLALVNKMEPIEIKEGNIKLTASFSGDSARIVWMYTENGVDFSQKSLILDFENRVLKKLADSYFLFTIGSTTVNVSEDRAVELATNALRSYSWNADGQTVTNVNVAGAPSAIFHPNTKGSTALYPQWTVTFYLDKIYPGNVNSITVGVWADTGAIAQIKTQNS